MTSANLRFFWLSCLFLSLSACQLGIHKDDETISLQVDYYKEQCDDDSAALCYRIREDEDDDWKIWTGPFNDFENYQWGYVYTLKVVVSYKSGGSVPSAYRYESTTETETVTGSDQYLNLDLHTDTGILAQLTDSLWNMGNEVDFTCGDDCEDLSALVAEQQIGSLEFRAAEGELTLTGVLCSTGDDDDFDSNCSGKSTENWYMAQFLSDCGFTSAALCLLYRVTESDPFELLPLEDGIDDFTLSWGTRYDIDVIKTVSGGGNITQAELTDENTSTAAVGSAWDFLFVVRGDALDTSSDGLIDLYDSNVSLDCTSYSLCSELNRNIEDDEYLLLQGYVESTTVTVITDIICGDATYGVFTSCVDNQDVDDNFNWPI